MLSSLWNTLLGRRTRKQSRSTARGRHNPRRLGARIEQLESRLAMAIADGFKIYNALYFDGQPTVASGVPGGVPDFAQMATNYGFETNPTFSISYGDVVSTDQWGPTAQAFKLYQANTNWTIDQAQVNAYVATLPDHSRIFLDYEGTTWCYQGNVNITKTDFTKLKLVEMINAIKTARGAGNPRDIQVGVYNGLGAGAYWPVVGYDAGYSYAYQDYANWKWDTSYFGSPSYANNVAAAEDFHCPSLYTPYSNDWANWQTVTSYTLGAIKNMVGNDGKEIIPFLTPTYHEGTAGLQTQMLSATEIKNQLQFLDDDSQHKSADPNLAQNVHVAGVMMWGGFAQNWNTQAVNSSWFQGMEQFLRKPTFSTRIPDTILDDGVANNVVETTTGTGEAFNWKTKAQFGGAKISQWVYLDPANMPQEIMLQFVTSSVVNGADTSNYEHRAYWGANLLSYGTDNTAHNDPSRYYVGALPTGGGWVELQVSAESVGLTGSEIYGVNFMLSGGAAAWGKTSLVNGPNATPIVWMDGQLPRGVAYPYSYNDGAANTSSWDWRSSVTFAGATVASPTGGLIHISNAAAGTHYHGFGISGSSAAPMRPGVLTAKSGARFDVTNTVAGYHKHSFAGLQPTTVSQTARFVTHVYIDPQNLPTEVMLEVTTTNANGTGARVDTAYWGANSIVPTPIAGQGAPPTRFQVSATVPTSGQWNRLDVFASSMGIAAGRKITGVSFSLFGGRAAWDAFGTVDVYRPQLGTVSAVEFVSARNRSNDSFAANDGDWKNLVGRQGYILAGGAAQYPSYANLSFTTAPNGSTLMNPVNTTTTSSMGLQAPDYTAANNKRLGNAWVGTSFVAAMNFTDESTHQVSLYFWAPDGVDRHLKIEAFDASGNLIDSYVINRQAYYQSPTSGPTLTDRGFWLTYKVTGYALFRISGATDSPKYGANALITNAAVLSGIFFDEA